MKTCPNCGTQVGIFTNTCSCGFNWGSDSPAVLVRDLRARGGFRPVHEDEPTERVVVWPWVVVLVLIVLGGWHVYCAQKLEATIYEYVTSHVGDIPVDARIEIHVQPITNVVAIDLKLSGNGAKSLKPSERLMIEATTSYIRSAAEPYFERELALIARKQVDLYAMALPYRLALSLDVAPDR